MMNFQTLLSRADTQLLDGFLPAGAGVLIRQIDPSLAYPSRLGSLLLSLYSPLALLLNAPVRHELIDLLTPKEALEIAKHMGLSVSEDCFTVLKGLRLAKNDEKQRFVSFFGLTYEETPKLDKPSTVQLEPAYGLFAHQITALAKVRELLDAEGGRALLHMPTGSGKTRTAVNLACEYLRQNLGRVVIWLANSEELCEQAYDEFSRAWGSLGNRPIQSYKCWGSYSLPPTDEIREGFVVLGLAKGFSRISNGFSDVAELGAKQPLVIFDEAHQAIAPTYRQVIDLLVRPYSASKLLGLSATPGRSWNDPDQDLELSDFFNRNKVTLTVDGYSNPVAYLIDQGYLARPIFKRIFSGANVSLSASEEQQLSTTFDLPKKILELLGSHEKRNLAIVYEAERLLKQHKRVILFASSVVQSDLLAAVLQARGHFARSITSNTVDADRISGLAIFKDFDETPRILCNFGILTTGFDAPRTSAALIARPTISLVLYSQMIGRALRGPRAGGNSSAEIVTVIDDGLEEFNSVEKAFSNWEDVWSQ